MKGESDQELDSLLAQGRLSGPARDRIFDAVVAANRPAPRWRRLLLWALPLSTVAALLLLILRPSEFRARGAGGPILEAVCATEPCRVGSALMFRASAVDVGGFLAAYALSAGVDERIWYFPSPDGECPTVDVESGTQTLPRGVRVGPEQPPGRYRVHLLLSRRPLTRAEALSPPGGVVLAESDVTIEIVK
jgi:hypothetical protein